MSKPFLSIERLTQKFPDGQGGELTVFENASFGVEKGEFVCILGHSGCGKSTIMNILAGLAEPTSGVVKMDGMEVSGPSLDRGVVFQNYSLLPWLSALKNVIFGVKARHPDWPRDKAEAHARDFLAKVGLEGDVVHRKPSQLSGGMRQRVSIARAFANHPKLLLLDEPFGALDALTRGTIQDELLKIWGGTEQTVFMITHDIDEAILLADRILLMTNGPFARVAESVEITIPRPRNRTEIVEHPNYYAIRNHLVHFLGSRSKELAGQKVDGDDLRPDTVRIDQAGIVTDSPGDARSSPRLHAVND
ncbi:nitrate/nitrite transport system ATP-binding protein [Roseovarius pacificus]|uniref:Nitrate/nitrite transport system ATP-binding protein n=1 Tax=Roseovarius pacificus TaxID=337701 RepID=A0A1M7ABG3_9RHOB|nr:ABC transporter ATP-binding protein [Roseovarius pacificus]GGO53668.1 nitrate/sulfonate/bicarbonate ABC transporter ATP-binding protein [Roseovarius pacificus]SHL39889.1 nitrate/nitrite transport system ATP-binding protein [Roseovarius pacificus]